MKISTLFCCILMVGCGSLKSSDAGAFFRKTKTPKYLYPLKDGNYKTPCINLPFIDKHFPERLGEVIRLHNPKVDPVGAYKVSRDLIKTEGKSKTHIIDTNSVKLCKIGDEMGYLFKAIKVSK